MYREKRNIGISIVLCLITCGLYVFYWIYQLNEDIQSLNPDNVYTSSGLVVLLSLVTCGLYNIYWNYKMGEFIREAQIKKGLRETDNSLLFILLYIISLGIVSLAIMQSDINEMIDYDEITQYPF